MSLSGLLRCGTRVLVIKFYESLKGHIMLHYQQLFLTERSCGQSVY